MNKQKLTIVKIGGNVIDDELTLKLFLQQFTVIPGNKILVHGGGKIATELSHKLNIEVKMHEGKRITDKASLDITIMAYAGLINKKIVSLLQALSCNAIGLSGVDGNSIKATKRPVKEIDYGYVGDLEVENINNNFFHKLLEQGTIPVLSAITHDGEGNMLNTNADTIASYVAMGLSKIYDVKLIYCFEKNGVLKNIHDELSVIKTINSKLYLELKNKKLIHSGMIPKMDNAFKALKNGVKSIQIGKAEQLLNILNNEHESTTLCN